MRTSLKHIIHGRKAFFVALCLAITVYADAQSCGPNPPPPPPGSSNSSSGGTDSRGGGCHGCGNPHGGGPSSPGGGGSSWQITTLHASDPNEIQGPFGIGTKKWMAAKDIFGYIVRYENDPEFATGPAQKVLITVPVDSNLDINSLRLGNFGFGNMIFTVPPNSATYYKRLDLRDSLGLYVDVLAGINVTDHQAIFVFESIDPATGTEPTNPSVGFLPVRDTSINRFNDSIPNKGEGFVTYFIKPATGVHTGDTVKAQAAILFDINAPVLTNTWVNTIDAVAPTSHIELLPSFVNPDFPVQWSGADDSLGVGLKNYDIYVSKDNGPFELLRGQTTDVGLQFTGGVAGSVYSFYSLATDLTGNREAVKNGADHSTIVNAQNAVVCPGNNIAYSFTQQTGSYSYQWQVDTGNGFAAINNSLVYSGASTGMLTLVAAPTSYYGYKYRCVATGSSGTLISGVWELKFGMTWTGSAGTAWEDPANWSCSAVPDGYVDVIVNSGVPNYPQINSNGACRSLKLGNTVALTVKAGYSLSIKGK